MHPELRKLCDEACYLSESERGDNGYRAAQNLYNALTRHCSYPNGSKLLYATAGLLLEQTGSFSQSVYRFICRTFGLNRTYDQVYESINNNFREFGRTMLETIDKFTGDEYKYFCLYAVLFFSCDGMLSSREIDFIEKYISA